MHSALSRLNTVASYTITAFSIISIVGFFHSSVNVDMENVAFDTNHYRVNNYKRTVDDETGIDVALFNFNLNANLTGLFNWNVRQIFLLLAAEYWTKANTDAVVVWDKIVLRDDDAVLELRKLRPKYYVSGLDGDDVVRNRNVTLTLSWNLIPHVGLLPLTTSKFIHRVFKD